MAKQIELVLAQSTDSLSNDMLQCYCGMSKIMVLLPAALLLTLNLANFSAFFATVASVIS